ncbi:MAG: hypothetical protein IJU23_10485 [Proteobacteria bacterium]|nr:hypothetical protein [Pseudomonadota bacterium]
MKKYLSYIVILAVTIAFALTACGCNMVAEEFKWYVQNVKEKGLYTASLEFTENALIVGGAAAIVAPEIGLVVGLYAIDDASEMDTAETILAVGNVAGFAAGTVLILAPAAAISAIGLATQGVPDNYDGGLFSMLDSSIGASCHRDYDCAKSVCETGECSGIISAEVCMGDTDNFGYYKNHCLLYKTHNVELREPECLLDIDCGNGLCLNGQCAPDITCESRQDCPLANHACINGKCLVYKDCVLDQDCIDRKDGTNYCNADLECVAKVECVDSMDCAGNSICYQDVCIDCRFDSECGDGLVCFNGRCAIPEAVPAAAFGQL